MSLIGVLIEKKYVTLAGLGIESPWIQALVVGISVKALMKISFFNVAAGASTMPIGVATITSLYEPALLDRLSEGVWNKGRIFLEPYAKEHSVIDDVRTKNSK